MNNNEYPNTIPNRLHFRKEIYPINYISVKLRKELFIIIVISPRSRENILIFTLDEPKKFGNIKNNAWGNEME